MVKQGNSKHLNPILQIQMVPMRLSDRNKGKYFRMQSMVDNLIDKLKVDDKRLVGLAQVYHLEP